MPFLLQTRPRALSEVEKVKEQLDNYEAKCLYCGRKMETILDQLQSCIDEFEIPDQHQDTVYLGIAGLKQVILVVMIMYMYVKIFCNYIIYPIVLFAVSVDCIKF